MDNKILYAHKNGMHFYKLEGQITHVISAGFDESINRVFSLQDTTCVLIDLSCAEYLDSTNLGLLAKIARMMIDKKLGKSTLISPNDEVLTILDSMGLVDIFEITTQNYQHEKSYEVIDSEDVGLDKKAKLLLETHRELMNMNDKNQQVFKDVVIVLEKELGNSSYE